MKIMYITPISFNSYSIKRNNFSNISFQAKIDETNLAYQKLINSDYKLYNNNVSFIKNGKKASGLAFVRETKYDLSVVITDDKFIQVGKAEAVLHDDSAEVCINNFYRNTMKHIGTAGYDNLFDYIRKKHPEIKKVKANVITDESFKFHTAYGFKIGKEEVEININNFLDTFMEYPLK